jgi:hypothetical protein
MALGSIWALSSPLGAVSDEPAHVIKAVAIADGVLRGHDLTTVSKDPKIPSGTVTTFVETKAVADLSARKDCWVLSARQPAGCMPAVDNDRTPVPVSVYSGNYPPFFYAVVGWPIHLLDLRHAVFAMRLISVILSAALLASGLASALHTGGRVGLLAGSALALTPMTFHLIGSVNPNGLEIAAAFCVWLSLIDLVTGPEPPSTRLLVRVVVSAGVLAASRPLSPAYLVFIWLAVVLVVGSWSSLGQLWRAWKVRIATAALAALVAVDLIALIELRVLTSFSGFYQPGLTHGAALRGSIDRIPARSLEMIGLFGWGSTPVPRWVSDGWLLLVALLFVFALIVATWRERFALALVAVGAVSVGVVSETLKAPSLGYIWQGRYTLPLAIGIPVLAGWVVAERGRLGARGMTGVATGVAIGAGIGQVVGHAVWMRRNIVGVDHPILSYLRGNGWVPPLPAWFLGASVTLASFAWVVAIVCWSRRDPLLEARLAGLAESHAANILQVGRGDSPTDAEVAPS